MTSRILLMLAVGSLSGCSIDLSSSLEGRPCGPGRSCLPGYTCSSDERCVSRENAGGEGGRSGSDASASGASGTSNAGGSDAGSISTDATVLADASRDARPDTGDVAGGALVEAGAGGAVGAGGAGAGGAAAGGSGTGGVAAGGGPATGGTTGAGGVTGAEVTCNGLACTAGQGCCLSTHPGFPTLPDPADFSCGPSTSGCEYAYLCDGDHDCSPGEVCCAVRESGNWTARCQASCAPSSTEMRLECTRSEHCGAGLRCCGDWNGGYFRFGEVRCVSTACAAPDAVLCGTNAECPASQPSCTPSSAVPGFMRCL